MRILFMIVGLGALAGACGGDASTKDPTTPSDPLTDTVTDPAPIDNDQDGYDASTDCDDDDAAVNPGATEVCNGIDDDCNGTLDDDLLVDAYPDVDEDGFGDSQVAATSACEIPKGYVTDHTDCDDASPSINPDGVEVCNDADDDCDGTPDDGLAFVDYYPDVDEDGFGDDGVAASSACSVPAGMVTNRSDCDDASASVSPEGTEVCNDVDDDCDGTPDDGLTFVDYYPDADLDTYGDANGSPTSACEQEVGTAPNALDCDDGSDAIHPGATEICNLVDDDCNAAVDEGLGTPRVNMALGATASASSTYAGYSASQAVDGSRSTSLGGSNSWTNSSTGGQYLELDFGSSQTFGRIDLYTTAGYEMADFDVEYHNGTSWVTIASYVDNTDVHVVTTFLPISASRIRFNNVVGPDAQAQYARINEIEVYANQAPDATSSASSTFSGYSASRVIDGSRSTATGGTYSWSNAGSGTLPATLELDFGECRDFSHIEMFTTSSLEIVEYDLEYWDGADWVLIEEVRLNGSVQVSSTFEDVAAEKVRLKALYGSAAQPAYARVNELEVY